MGIMLVYDVTDSKSFDSIAKWLRNIDEVSSVLDPWLVGQAPFLTVSRFQLVLERQ